MAGIVINTNERLAAGSSVVRKCDCTSAYQDDRYGKGLRVHNVGKATVACTVCSKKK